MTRMRTLAAGAATLAALLAAEGSAAERPAQSRLCPEDLPEGVRLRPPPGCAATEQAKPRADGFRDLGGVSVRVGGRISADVGAGR